MSRPLTSLNYPQTSTQKHCEQRSASLSGENLTTSYHSEEYLAPVPENERGDMVKAYHKLLNSEDDNVRYDSISVTLAALADAAYLVESRLPRLGRSGSKYINHPNESTEANSALVLQDGYFAVDC